MKYVLLATLILLWSCGKKAEDSKPEEKVPKKSNFQVIEPDLISEWNEDNNIDSPAFFQKSEEENWTIATAKSTDKLVIYDVMTADSINAIGIEGNGKGQLDRPNGIWVQDNYCFVVERNNKRVQVFELPEFKSLGFFGVDRMMKPYGLSVHTIQEDEEKMYKVYVTDNYEFEEDVIPADSLLGKRVLEYEVKIGEDKIISDFKKYIGETSGEGVLKVVESIMYDSKMDKLYICEELEGKGNTHIKVYDTTGTYKSKFGLDIFTSQAEGLALIDTEQGGYLVSTDQALEHNIFHFFDRYTLKLLASFDSGKLTNTDGIWITQTQVGDFKKGVFIAVNNDGGIGIWDLEKLLSKINLEI